MMSSSEDWREYYGIWGCQHLNHWISMGMQTAVLICVDGQAPGFPKGLNFSDFLGIPPPGDATGIDRLLSSDLGLVPGGPSKSHSTSRTRSAR